MRLAGDYELSHVPGAANIGAKALFTADGLAQIPADKDVVVYCYTGQTSSQATSALNMLGYKAKSMKFGFPSWSNEMLDQQSGSQPFNNDTDRHDYRTSDEAVAAESGNAPAAALGDTAQAAAEAYFINGTKNVKSSDVFENLNDGDDSNDPLIIDVRSAEDYATSHIPGAINNPSGKTLFTADGLAGIPTDKQVVVNCYTGQTASQVTSVLNMLGYDAANLKFGFASWSSDGGYSFDAAKSPNYRTESGAAEAAPAAAPAAEATATPEAAPAPLKQPCHKTTAKEFEAMVKRKSTFISILILLSLILTGVVTMAQGPVQEAADDFFSGGPKHIAAVGVFDNLNDGDDGNNPFIIDVRKPEDYALSHVPGAVNIGVTALFTADKLAELP
ncbi:MAG: hypothetical protein B6243_14150, partial [Anaerolineaceae bacterium 4572_5.2]